MPNIGHSKTWPMAVNACELVGAEPATCTSGLDSVAGGSLLRISFRVSRTSELLWLELDGVLMHVSGRWLHNPTIMDDTYDWSAYFGGSGYTHSQPSRAHPAQDGLPLEHLTLRARHTKQAVGARGRRAGPILSLLPASVLAKMDGLAASPRGEDQLVLLRRRLISGVESRLE